MGSTRHTSSTNNPTVRRARPRARSVPVALAVSVVAGLAFAGCAGDDDDSMDASAEGDRAAAADTAAPAATTPAQDDQSLAATGGEAPAGTEQGGAGGVGGGDAGLELGSIGRDVIVELHVQMESDDIARSVAAVTADAVTFGGGVASSDISYGTENADGESNADGHAVIVVKVPPDSVGRLLDNLDASGRVTSVDQSAQDVTEQLVDLDVRIDNARESVENVRRFMEQTANLTDLVSLESELMRRQTELEQLEAQQRNLSERVAMSTVTIEIRPTPPEAVPELADEEDDSIGDAFGTGWDAFAGLLFGLAFVLAVLAPFVVTGLVVLAFAWLIVRLTRRSARPAERAPADDELTPV